MEKFYNIYKSGVSRANYIKNGTTYIYIMNFSVIVGVYDGYVSICNVINYDASLSSYKEKINHHAVDLVEQYDIMNLTFDEFIHLHFQLSLIKD